MAVIIATMQNDNMLRSLFMVCNLFSLFSVPMMFELIPFDCSRILLFAEVSAKWINFDFLSLTSFDFCTSLIAACSQDSRNYCLLHI